MNKGLKTIIFANYFLNPLTLFEVSSGFEPLYEVLQTSA